jgi:hypothetical protein
MVRGWGHRPREQAALSAKKEVQEMRNHQTGPPSVFAEVFVEACYAVEVSTT